MIGLALVAIEFVRRLPMGRTALAATLGAVLLIAAVVTYQRNNVWSGAIPLWEDAVKNLRASCVLIFNSPTPISPKIAARRRTSSIRLSRNWRSPITACCSTGRWSDNCLNKLDEALQKLQQAAALEKTAHVYTQIAMIYAKTGKFDQSFQALADAQAIDPSFDATYLYRGQLFQATNNLPAAERNFARRWPSIPGTSRRSRRCNRFKRI